MKTIYLREKRSGNFELTGNRNEATHKFNKVSDVKDFFERNARRIIKASYRLSQTYYDSTEFKKFRENAGF